DLELAGDDRREGRLAEARRSVEEDVVSGLSPAPRGGEQDRQVGLDVALADVLVERLRPEGALDDAVTVVEQVRGDDPGDLVGHRRQRYHGRRQIARPFDAVPTSSPPSQVGVGAYSGDAPFPPLRVRP